MKKILFTVALIGSTLGVFANQYTNIKPTAAPKQAAPTAVHWQNVNQKALDEALSCKTISGLVATDKSMADLLAKVQGAYLTEPIVATQIMEISHKVMCNKCPKAAGVRVRWVAALLSAAKSSTDIYRTTFFLDQLRWCGRKSDVKAINAIAAASNSKAIKDFAAMVIRELNTVE